MRKPKPTALKLLAGNPGKRALNPAEPQPKLGRPEPLDCLTAAARIHFDDLSEKLEAVRVLTVNDGAAISALAQSIASYEEATRRLETDGYVIKDAGNRLHRSPWVIIQKQAWEQMYRGLTEFGLTASSRSKITAVPESPESNPFANLA